MRIFTPALILLMSTTLVGCPDDTDDTDIGTGTEADSDTDSDSDSDTDSDSDSDTDSDSDSDTDSDSDSEADTDADTAIADCPVDLDPQDDGGTATQTLPGIIFSEIDPGSYIELFNTTDSDIALSGIGHRFCAPFAYVALSDNAGVVVPANGYAELPWPSNFTADNDAGGEMILYIDASFGTDASIADYICWGSSDEDRKEQAEAVGKWTGDCAPAITNGSIARAVGTAGTASGDYIVNEAREADTCTATQ